MSTQTTSSILMRILTHNIRLQTTNLSPNKEPWRVRKAYILNELEFNTDSSPEAIISMQEVLRPQLKDILNGLNSSPSGGDWNYIGIGRDGEYSHMLYRSSVWKKED